MYVVNVLKFRYRALQNTGRVKMLRCDRFLDDQLKLLTHSSGGSARGRPARSKFFHLHVFFANILPNNRLAPLFGLAPQSGIILDAQLHSYFQHQDPNQVSIYWTVYSGTSLHELILNQISHLANGMGEMENCRCGNIDNFRFLFGK